MSFTIKITKPVTPAQAFKLTKAGGKYDCLLFLMLSVSLADN
jgi:hypothetical protein